VTKQEFFRICQFVYKQYGIDLTKKEEFVHGRLDNLLRKNGWGSYDNYMNIVESDVTGMRKREMMDLLTTNHTFFMREGEHFDYMRREVLPWLAGKERKSKDLRIWCGAASTGEEPYTLAMLLIDYFGLEHKNWDTKVLATDLSTRVLKKAVKGEYTRQQIQPLPERWKRRFFRQSMGEDIYRVTEELKQEVIFRQFNLMDEFPFRRKMHVIFLRNVMIYFDKETKQALLKRICRLLEPGGYLFVGQTETVDRHGLALDMVRPAVFRKTEA
jgi:chemotaxis protein methyltransferase CheR